MYAIRSYYEKRNKWIFASLGILILLLAAGFLGWFYLKGKETVLLETAEPMEIGTTVTKESGNWKLVWSDEFTGDRLDETKWDYQIGNGVRYGVTDWGNNEAEYYSEDNVTVSHGTLKIEAKREELGGKSYTSGRIRTLADPKEDGTGRETLFSTKYGRIEARMKLPTGTGLWPAFWLLPDPNGNTYGNWAASGEIDIMEARGRIPDETSGTISYNFV